MSIFTMQNLSFQFHFHVTCVCVCFLCCFFGVGFFSLWISLYVFLFSAVFAHDHFSGGLNLISRKAAAENKLLLCILMRE